MSRFYRFGDIVHFRWGGDRSVHSAALVVGRTRDDMLLILPMSDTNLVIDPYTTHIVAKVAAMYEPCAHWCPHHPDYPDYQEIK